MRKIRSPSRRGGAIAIALLNVFLTMLDLTVVKQQDAAPPTFAPP